jgi:ribosome-binding ATPase YchF (GTP1/OBG family)
MSEQGGGSGDNRHRDHPPSKSSSNDHTSPSCASKRTLLVLHGNRQTGQLFLGRLNRIQKRLHKRNVDLAVLAVDAPFEYQDGREEDGADGDDDGDIKLQLTWWHRHGDSCVGLETALEKIQNETLDKQVVGILGFSQGARLAHLLALLHTSNSRKWFPDLKFVILAAGYDAPIPPELSSQLSHEVGQSQKVSKPLASLHIWGQNDALITPPQSETLSLHYQNPETFVHPGGHFVPSKTPNVERYIDFIENAMTKGNDDSDTVEDSRSTPTNTAIENIEPDEESKLMQQEEVQSLEAIFPEEIELTSAKSVDGESGEEMFTFPICYRFRLSPQEDVAPETTNWPPQPLTLQVQYPHNYPLEAIPQFKILHENTVFEMSSRQVERLMNVIQGAATAELGMSSVLTAVYAARDFLDAPREEETMDDMVQGITHKNEIAQGPSEPTMGFKGSSSHPLIQESSSSEIEKGILEGLQIAESMLQRSVDDKHHAISTYGKGGGSFGTYTIGLVGKPSAGKSTFFNAATAFSRQRGQHEGEGDASEWGGASMAAHPFTTIDPNIGYCLVPAPPGSCPEDDLPTEEAFKFGSTHGRDPNGRRFLPVLLKDVAGLVPGAYQGKGRGNQFLNDLTDATVLIHVADASGSADSSGNNIVSTDGDEVVNDIQYSNPIDDLAWIRRELLEWVYSNLMAKWDVVARKGRSKLAGMFSGYGQREVMVEMVFSALEKFLEEHYHRDKDLDHISSWNECDVHRIVSAFLGMRFPMAICMNKYDLPSAKPFVEQIEESLPIHGAHVGVPLSAKSEMLFVRQEMSGSKQDGEVSPPLGVWKCLTAAMTLREPILVFPVSDLTTLAPMPGLNKAAVEDPSLPSQGMIRCINVAGGSEPTCWSSPTASYLMPAKNNKERVAARLRDVLMMKPRSTVEDVFLTLKRLGGLSGEFLRAEACSGAPDDKPKPIPKTEVMNRRICVIKIMTNKRTAWQSS